MFAGTPAKLQWSYFAFRLQWLKNKLIGSSGAESAVAVKNGEGVSGDGVSSDGDNFAVSLADFPAGSIRSVSSGICVARIDEDRIVAFSRRCPHEGADLVEGFVHDGAIVCPWHNLHFDPETGASSCKSLKPLRRYACEVRDDQVQISKVQEPSEPSQSADA